MYMFLMLRMQQESILMNSDFGSDLVTVSDDDGNVFMLEHLDTIEIDKVFYAAFLPADMDEEDDDYGVVILKAVEENGESFFVSVDNDDLLNHLHELFTERLFSEDDNNDEE